MNISEIKGKPIIVLPVNRKRGYIAFARAQLALEGDGLLTASELHTKVGLVSNGKNEYAWARDMETRGLVEAVLVGRKIYYRKKRLLAKSEAKK